MEVTLHHMTITVDGKPHSVKALEDLTLADYRAITAPFPEDAKPKAQHEFLVEILKRVTGIPKTQLRRVPMAQMRKAFEAAQSWIDGVAAAKKAAEGYTPPETLKIGGIEYVVPPDVSQVPFGQYESLSFLLEGAETEVDCYAALLAVFLVPVGEEFDGDKVMERMAAFEKAPMRDVLGVCGFFLSSEKELSAALLPYFLKYQMGRTLRDAFLTARTLTASTDPD